MDDGLLKAFVTESNEHLAGIEVDLLAVEESGDEVDFELVNGVFRAAHSIKGSSAYFGFHKVKDLAHGAETVLDLVRSRRLAPDAAVIDVLLVAFDRLRDLINNIGESERAEIGGLLESLANLAGGPGGDGEAEHPGVPLVFRDAGGGEVSLRRDEVARADREGRRIYRVDFDFSAEIEKRGRSIYALFYDLSRFGEVLDCMLDYAAVGTLSGPLQGRVLPLRLVVSTPLDPAALREVFGGLPEERVRLLSGAGPVPSTLPEQSIPPARVSGTRFRERTRDRRAEPSYAGAGGDTLRVNVELLESLMNLAGELVLCRNQLRATVAQESAGPLLTAVQRIGLVTSDLQDVVMKTRLQPVGNVFSRFPRLVRDLAASLGKEVRLEITGNEVALDKTMIEGLSDPLTHMVRNAVDHGIEVVEERVRRGKPAEGRLRIEARHEAGQVLIEIADDGKGIDPARIAEAAVRLGLSSADAVQALSDQARLELVFLPGLSTSRRVSEVSGRGVGMDVVKANLERLGGQIEIDSLPGKGARFRIRLPLTLTIIPTLVVRIGETRFAVPQINVEELIRVRPEEVGSRIEFVGDSEVLVLRDRLLPLVRPAELFGIVPDSGAAAALKIAVITTGTISFAMPVDDFEDTEEVVVKPLGCRLKQLREYAGATILGDGTVILILDAAGLAAKAGLGVDASSRVAVAAAAEAVGAEAFSLLVFHNGPEEPCAIPLELVQRLERIDAKRIQNLGSARTMQYGDGSLPLVALSDVARVAPIEAQSGLVVLVTEAYGRRFGLLGTLPVDVVESDGVIDQVSHRQKGIAGSAIIEGRTTLIADIHELIYAIHPDWVLEGTGGPVPPGAGGEVVLLAEDSAFFRAQVKRFLEADGFIVLEAADGETAWDLLLANLGSVRAVITDIDMPRLSGLGLVERIREDGRTAALPVMALTSLAGDDDVVRGRTAGIDEYRIKFKPDELLASLRGLLHAKSLRKECVS